MYKISVDVGYSYTKTHEMLIFPSRVKKGGDLVLGSEVFYMGERYSVGFGQSDLELNKVNSDVTKVCCLYAICKSTEDNDIVLMTGLPIGQFTSQKQALKDSFLKDNDIIIKNKERKLKIHDVKVYPQGAGALYSADIQGDAILVDIGGRTVDIAYFEEQPDGRKVLKKFSTLYCGVIPLYSKVIHEINSKFNLSLAPDDGEKVLRNGLAINGVSQKLDFAKEIMKDHIQELRNELVLNYPTKTTPIYLCGGGSYLFKSIGHKVLDNGQFANAIGFYRMGVR